MKIDSQERAFFLNEQAKNSKEYRAFQIFEKLRDAAIEGLCRLVEQDDVFCKRDERCFLFY